MCQPKVRVIRLSFLVGLSGVTFPASRSSGNVTPTMVNFVRLSSRLQPLYRMLTKNVVPQSPCICVTHMVDPALKTCVKFRKWDVPRPIEVKITHQPLRKMDHIPPFDASVGRKDNK